jgi:nucleoside-diphosphate-sugar epimerase
VAAAGRSLATRNFGEKMPDSVAFSRRPALVLGGSGYIGSRVVAALSANPIYQTVAASRRSAVRVDATDVDAVRSALRDVHLVINSVAGSPRAMVQATQALCEAAREAPPHRIVHLSSMAVYGAATGTVREDHVPVMPTGRYGDAKIQCENIVQKYIDDGGDAVILRPTCVFGPGSAQWTTRLARLLAAGRIGDLGAAGDGCCNLTFIDDLVAAIVMALDAPHAACRTFNISSTSALTWNEFLLAFAKALGATPVRRISARKLQIETHMLAPMRRLAAMAVRTPWTEAITPSLSALWQQDIRVDCGAAEAALGMHWTPLNQMIAAAVRTEAVVRASAMS